MKAYFVLTALLFSHTLDLTGQSVKVDTILYNNEWKVVTHNALADYYRIVVDSPNEYEKQFRDFYITGELNRRGGYVHLDTLDDYKSVYNGEHIQYYQDGSICEKCTYKNGVLTGEYTRYKINGEIDVHCYYLNDKIDGIHTHFNDNGQCIQTEYSNGTPKDYYTLSNEGGLVMKIDAVTNEPIWESPNESESEAVFINGKEWTFYDKNSIIIGVKLNKTKDYGKVYKVDVVITNNSLFPIVFAPEEQVDAISINNKGEIVSNNVMSSDEFMKKVERAQMWAAVAVGIGEGLSSTNTGTSTSETVSQTKSTGTINAYPQNIYDNTAKVGYNNRTTTVTHTTTYDKNAAYQAQVASQNRLAEFDASQARERELKEEGYLKKTTIYPADVVTGYFNIERDRNEEQLTIILNFSGAEYKFNWTGLGKVK